MAFQSSTDPEAGRERLDRIFDETWRDLTAPGAPYEIEPVVVRGRRVSQYACAPADVRTMWSDTARWADRDYLIYRGERFSYARVHAISASVAAWLWARGVRRGDRVAIAMRNYPEWLMIYWGCLSIGVAVVAINAWWIADEIAFAMDDSSPKAIFCDGERLDRLTARPGALGTATVIAVRAPAAAGQTAWSEVLDTPSEMPLANIDPDDDASILYTSGTTGVPKGAQLTHRGFINTLMNIAFATEVHAAAERRARDGASTPATLPAALVTTPLFHVTALGLAFAITAAGGKLVLMHKWDAEEALRLIEAERITNVSGVPTIGRELIQHPRFAEHDVTSLAALVGGGAPVPPDLIAKIDATSAPVRPHVGYGMTETHGPLAANVGDYLIQRPASCGKILPTFESKVVAEDGAPCPPGVAGEVWIRGGGVIKGYLNRPDATAESIRDGWLLTGDIGWVDANDYLHIVDRKKDMILRGGENVYCAEVEAALFHHPAVLDACAFGVPDERLGEEVGAAVQLAPGAAVSPADLRRHAGQYLAAYKVPAFIWTVDNPLPRNAAGKPLRRELRSLLDSADAR